MRLRWSNPSMAAFSAILLCASALPLAAKAATVTRYEVVDIGSVGLHTITDNGFINNNGDVAGSGGNTSYSYSSGTLVDLGQFGSIRSGVNGLGDNGTIAGVFAHPIVTDHDYVIEGGVFHDITPTSFDARTGGVSNNGTVVGTNCVTANTPACGSVFTYKNGAMTTVAGLVGTPTGINDSGEITGSTLFGGQLHAFLYDGTTHDLGTLGGNASFATAINDAGVVVGTSNTATGRHAFAYSGGVMHDLGSLGGDSAANDINSLGAVVGASNGFAFLYADGQMQNLDLLIADDSPYHNAPVGLFANALSINDLGQILVTGTQRNGALSFEKAFILNPIQVAAGVPEPAAWLLMITGFGLVGSRVRARRAVAHVA